MAARVQPRAERGTFFVALAGIAVLSLAATVRYLWPLPDRAPSALVSAGHVDRFIANEPVAFEGKFWLVKRDNGEVLALSMKDPDLGCSVVWRPDFRFEGRRGWFQNPCRGQVYDLQGFCHYGPCVRGLDRYPVAVQSGHVIVDTRRLDPGPPLRTEDCIGSYAGVCVPAGERFTCPARAWVRSIGDSDPLGLDPDHDGVACDQAAGAGRRRSRGLDDVPGRLCATCAGDDRLPYGLAWFSGAAARAGRMSRSSSAGGARDAS